MSTDWLDDLLKQLPPDDYARRTIEMHSRGFVAYLPSAVKLRDGGIWLPDVGWIKTPALRASDFPRSRVKTLWIGQDSSGKWLCEIDYLPDAES